MTDNSLLRMPEHREVSELDGFVYGPCKASTEPGYAQEFPPGDPKWGHLHCNRCGWVTPEKVVLTYSEETDRHYLTWAEYVSAETNGYVVVTVSSRPGTAPGVHGPWDTVAEARKAQSRLRRSARQHERPFTVKTYVRILHREKP